MNARVANIGVVVIGRNEGERLRVCLESALAQTDLVVYVDSGSSDQSVQLAKSLGVHVVALDPSRPFTAARARNAGIAKLCCVAPDIEFVQVVDGDCELVHDWITNAVAAMNETPRVGVVCGRRRERFPTASVYNTLCDMEWNTPVGEVNSCGGDALLRIAAFNQIKGFDESIIAGEEPEMCLRLRQAGWNVLRIDKEMTIHDARMAAFGQWWRRAMRCGHAYAEGHAMHGRAPVGFCAREVRSIVEWGLLLPITGFALAWATWGASLLLFVAYYALWSRIRSHRIKRGDDVQSASLYANYCVLGKFPEALGVVWYWWNRLCGRNAKIIEYKTSAPAADASTPEVCES